MMLNQEDIGIQLVGVNAMLENLRSREPGTRLDIKVSDDVDDATDSLNE